MITSGKRRYLVVMLFCCFAIAIATDGCGPLQEISCPSSCPSGTKCLQGDQCRVPCETDSDCAIAGYPSLGCQPIEGWSDGGNILLGKLCYPARSAECI